MILAVAIGIVVGFAAPGVAVELKPIGDGFVNLIKMMISPIIFCTIVLGIGSVRKAAKVGTVGGLALGYFLVMSTVALGIGLVVGNILEPGSGLDLTSELAKAGQGQAEAPSRPPNFCSASSRPRWCRRFGEVGAADLVRRAAGGLRDPGAGQIGEPVLRGVKHIQRVVFRVLSMIMWVAPIGAFGAIAAVVGETGVDALKCAGADHDRLLHHLRAVRLRGAGRDSAADSGRQHLPAAEVSGARNCC